jgi:mannose-6-phosphate isomerase-like protein (cupin superfamily)
VDGEEQWSTTFEGQAYGVDVSYIHLSTLRVDVGPPLHKHPYAEVVMIRQGRARFTVGTEELVARAGHTLVVPPETPHTFRTLDAGRYESVALHLSREFISELLEADNAFRGAPRRSRDGRC